MSAAPDPELFWHFVTDGGGFAGALLTRRECQISGVFFPEIKQYDTGECQRIKHQARHMLRQWIARVAKHQPP